MAHSHRTNEDKGPSKLRSTTADDDAEDLPPTNIGSFWGTLLKSVISFPRRAINNWPNSWRIRATGLGLAILSGSVLVWLVKLFILPERESLWAADKLDLVVTVALSAIILLGALMLLSVVLFPHSDRLKELRRDSIKWVGAVIVLLTLYAGYATFRNQGRLASEAALSAGGYHLYNLEMSHPEIRCLYFNYAHHDPRGCLERIISDPERWSFALFYVEEAWFQLEQAQTERIEWGSTYAQMIKYWAQDVSRDPTGLFAYYLVSSERSLDAAAETMRRSDVRIPAICANYRVVWRALYRRRAQPPLVSGAARECGSLPPVEPTILAAGELPIEEVE
ncbi:MAG: hypothetical protein ACT4O2_06145 [Beijerinckiaceae bacterium]